MAEPSTDELASDFEIDFDGGLPASVDRDAVRRMQFVARILDESIRVPGTSFRIGVDPLIGVVPVAGDVVSAGVSMYIVLESARLGVSYLTLLKMVVNVSIDVAGGSVPYVGVLFDAVWKANKRNIRLLLDDLTSESTTLEEVEPTRIDIE